jgi:hypothetical protein
MAFLRRRRRRGPGHRYDLADPAVQALLSTPASEWAARRAELQAAYAAGLWAEDIGQVLNSPRSFPGLCSLKSEQHSSLY